jgi:hypothetical protein
MLNVPLKTPHNNNNNNNINYDRVKCLIFYHKSIIIQTENDNYKLGINYYLFTLLIAYVLQSDFRKKHFISIGSVLKYRFNYLNTKYVIKIKEM